MLKKASIFLALIGLFSLSSCEETPFYEEYLAIDGSTWQVDSVARFEIEIEDTLSTYPIVLNIRANDDYPYANLYLFRKIYSEDGLEYSDTAEFKMADAYGRWLGVGIGELKTFKRVYRREPLRFNRPGTYRFEFVQAMRTDPLPGIEDFGLTIFKNEYGEAKED